MRQAHETIAMLIKGQVAMSGLKQQDIAERLGMSQQGLSKRLNGLTPFTINELQAILSVLHIGGMEMAEEVVKARAREARLDALKAKPRIANQPEPDVDVRLARATRLGRGRRSPPQPPVSDPRPASHPQDSGQSR